MRHVYQYKAHYMLKLAKKLKGKSDIPAYEQRFREIERMSDHDFLWLYVPPYSTIVETMKFRGRKVEVPKGQLSLALDNPNGG